METKTSLVGSYCGIELNPVSAVYLYLTIIINPWNPEHYNALRFHQTLNDTHFLQLGISLNYRLQ